METEERDAYLAFLRERREAILERLDKAARVSGRNPADIGMLAVSKTVGPEEVELAWEAGYRAFGENRPQELKRKLAGIAERPWMASARFDMIGNLQTNKINQVIGVVELIHSVSSLHLAQAISKRSEARGCTSRVLLEVNVSGEESKSGFSPDEVRLAMDDLLALPALSVEGVMTMAPAGDIAMARRTFSGLRELRDQLRQQSGLALDIMSCGMSDDFDVAVEEGSSLVRLGRTVFDPAHELFTR